MDQKQREKEFLARLLETFRVEAEEHVKTIADGLLALESNAPELNRSDTIETIYREAHSLKGAARAVNHTIIQEICQSLEDVLSALKDNKLPAEGAFFDEVHAAVNLISACITKGAEAPQESTTSQIAEMTERLKALKAGKNLPHPQVETKEPQPAKEAEVKEEEKASAQLHSPVEKAKTIRVSSTKLDQLLQEVEEMLIVKLAVGKRHQDLLGLENGFKELAKRSQELEETIRFFRQKITTASDKNEVKHLKTLLEFFDSQNDFIPNFQHHITASLANASQDARITVSMVDNLLEDTKKLLLQPFSTIFESFPRMIREISHSVGKETVFSSSGGDIEVDRRILEEIKDPLIHLLRNGIDHGIESSQEREQAGKAKEGRISVSAMQVSSNSVEITVQDDGKGILASQIRDAAIKHGANPNEVQAMNDQEALRLVFLSGVSTSPIITELSGRGLGMGIVSEKVEKLGGQIHIETVIGKGSTFKIILPISLGTFRGIQVQVGKHNFFLPTHSVKRVLRMNIGEIKTVEGTATIPFEHKTLSYAYLGNILHLDSSFKPADKIFVAVLKTGEVSVAIGVDRIVNEQEVFIKSLGRLLVKVNNLAGATILEEGKVIPVLDPFDLVKSVIQIGSIGQTQATAAKKSDAKERIIKILLAEDSLTARMLLKNILLSAGYQVKTAVDGAEAFAILKTEPVDLLITDVEMPRMDGFELTQKIRAIDKLKEMPIIICTSRGSREDREHGIEVGANAYIDKSSFAQNTLLDIIKKLL